MMVPFTVQLLLMVFRYTFCSIDPVSFLAIFPGFDFFDPFDTSDLPMRRRKRTCRTQKSRPEEEREDKQETIRNLLKTLDCTTVAPLDTQALSTGKCVAKVTAVDFTLQQVSLSWKLQRFR